jgi:hypothetical protein
MNFVGHISAKVKQFSPKRLDKNLVKSGFGSVQKSFLTPTLEENVPRLKQ